MSTSLIHKEFQKKKKTDENTGVVATGAQDVTYWVLVGGDASIKGLCEQTLVMRRMVRRDTER